MPARGSTANGPDRPAPLYPESPEIKPEPGTPNFRRVSCQGADLIIPTENKKAPQVADNNLKGRSSHAIDSRMSPHGSIVIQPRRKGKGHNVMPQLQYPIC
jgi:hypothetical protein